MKATVVLAVLACAYAAGLPSDSTTVLESERNSVPRESTIPVRGAELYAREVGHGTAIIVLHGGPDFDHSYLLPELDRLSDSYRLIYYDQRGRGRSAHGVKPEDVTLASDIADMDECGSTSNSTPWYCWGTPGVLCLPSNMRFAIRAGYLA